jgi:hypothetical protein
VRCASDEPVNGKQIVRATHCREAAYFIGAPVPEGPVPGSAPEPLLDPPVVSLVELEPEGEVDIVPDELPEPLEGEVVPYEELEPLEGELEPDDEPELLPLFIEPHAASTKAHAKGMVHFIIKILLKNIGGIAYKICMHANV